MLLSHDGFQNFAEAADGDETLRCVDSYMPDIVLLDVLMPGKDGFAICRALRERHSSRDLPILIQTALDDPDERARAFAAGANDLLTKPINKLELLGRINVHLENQRFFLEMESFRSRVAEELRLARDMQETLLPRPREVEAAGKHYGLRIEHVYRPSSELGGDFWAIRPLDDNRLRFSIVDFAGHGVTAALNTFRLHTLLADVDAPQEDPGRYLSLLNDRLHGLLSTGQFATVFTCVFDRYSDTLSYAAAASTPALVLQPGTPAVLASSDPSGLPIGVEPGVAYPTRELPLPEGCCLLAYSDALINVRLEDDSFLGADRFRELASRSFGQGPRSDFIATLLSELKALDARPFDDDLTVVALKRSPA